MSLKLDDLISKKKEVIQILDLSKATANNAEEFKRIMEKVPDFKVKPEKVKAEQVKSQDRPKRWKARRKRSPYGFAEPIPAEMRSLRLEDLCSVPIQWNMLTTLRPKAKLDEEYYSRLVELGKLELATSQKEKKVPMSEFLKKMKSRTGVTETKFTSCTECGEEFCKREVCYLLQYDNFKRQVIPETIGKKEREDRGRSKSRKKTKTRSRKSKSRGRSKSRKRSVSRDTSESEERSKSRERTRTKARSRGRSKSRRERKGEAKQKSPAQAKSKEASKSQVLRAKSKAKPKGPPRRPKNK